jgi:hypothetical protein
LVVLRTCLGACLGDCVGLGVGRACLDCLGDCLRDCLGDCVGLGISLRTCLGVGRACLGCLGDCLDGVGCLGDCLGILDFTFDVLCDVRLKDLLLRSSIAFNCLSDLFFNVFCLSPLNPSCSYCLVILRI